MGQTPLDDEMPNLNTQNIIQILFNSSFLLRVCMLVICLTYGAETSNKTRRKFYYMFQNITLLYVLLSNGISWKSGALIVRWSGALIVRYNCQKKGWIFVSKNPSIALEPLVRFKWQVGFSAKCLQMSTPIKYRTEHVHVRLQTDFHRLHHILHHI